MRRRFTRVVAILPWALLAVPAAWQIALLVSTVARRFWYPYDLEWMEGGMLAHALRYLDGHDLYEPPSIEFIPYLYTPLYPAILAALGAVVGVSYPLGRGVSVAGMLVIGALAVFAILRETGAWGRAPEARARRPLAWVCAATALGFYAATYPWVEGWYDLVRGDTTFLAIGMGGLVLLREAARREGRGPCGLWHPGVAAAAALLALSFFAKQTGVLLVFAGGAALLGLRPRALPVYIAVSGAVGGLGTLVLNWLSDGWFWIYVFEYHQQHDTHMPRFWASFRHVLGRFPAMSLTVAVSLVAVAWTARRLRRLPEGAVGFLYWTWIFACGTVIGALGWATQWAHFNAYIPAMTFGGVAAGLAAAALAGCAAALAPARPRLVGAAAGGLALALLGQQLWRDRWEPRPLIPTREDRHAGRRLVEELRQYPGDVWVPFHPFYAYLAGKRVFAHRMGLLDVTYVPPRGKKARPLPPRARQVEGLEAAMQNGRFDVVILDDRGKIHELPGLGQGYRMARRVSVLESPRVVSGAKTRPATVWLPKRTGPAGGAP